MKMLFLILWNITSGRVHWFLLSSKSFHQSQLSHCSRCVFAGPKHSLTQISQSMLDLCDEKLKEASLVNELGSEWRGRGGWECLRIEAMARQNTRLQWGEKSKGTSWVFCKVYLNFCSFHSGCGISQKTDAHSLLHYFTLWRLIFRLFSSLNWKILHKNGIYQVQSIW